jgi:putative chitobiose transport system substrate-binding protein
MNLVVPKSSAMAPEAVSFGLFLTDAANQLAFAQEARVLPSSQEALRRLEASLAQPGAAEPGEALVRRARGLSIEALQRARVLVPATPGIKRLQAIIYTQLQRAMLGDIDSDAALLAAAREWNGYAEARWP